MMMMIRLSTVTTTCSPAVKLTRLATAATTKFKTIDGKKYAFDEDGKMLYGWVNEDDCHPGYR